MNYYTVVIFFVTLHLDAGDMMLERRPSLLEASCHSLDECDEKPLPHGENIITISLGKNEDRDEKNDTEVTGPSYATNERGLDLGAPQVIDQQYAEEILSKIAEARQYIEDQVKVDSKYSKVRDICWNRYSNCAFWSVKGECEANPDFMLINCAPVCKSCERLHSSWRCPLDTDAVDALQPGDLDKLFENIVSDPNYQQFHPRVLSRPGYLLGDVPGQKDYKAGPWMVQFENALSDEEADRLIELGALEGYERSADVGDEQEDGTYTATTNSGRTSTNAWCNDVCYRDPVAQRVIRRIENITGIAETNSESLQLLRYEENQFYQMHSDYIPYQLERPCGVRILTFYFYLNDVEGGGGTNFPKMGITATPKKGRAILWPSVLNDEPNKKDIRTDHQALPVTKGVKYGANAWIHQRDYKKPSHERCC